MAKRRATVTPPTPTTPAADIYDELLEDAKTVEPKKPATARNKRDHLKLDGVEATAFDRFCMADSTLKMAKGEQEGTKAIILPVLTDKLLQAWCEEGHRTDNPEVRTEKGRAILQAREILKFEIPQDEEGKALTVTEMLTRAGFTLAEANAIREKEFTETSELRIANLTELRKSTESEPVLRKLLTLIKDNFTAAEKKVLIEKVNKVEVEEGFLDRAVGHVNRDPAKLKALLTTVRPQFLMSHIVWSGDLKDAVGVLQKKETGEQPKPSLPVAPAKPIVFTSDDGKWKAEAEGNVAKLHMVSGGRETLLGTKTCSGGAEHAKMTCQKWLRDADYRAESIAKFQQQQN